MTQDPKTFGDLLNKMVTRHVITSKSRDALLQHMKEDGVDVNSVILFPISDNVRSIDEQIITINKLTA